MSLDFRPGEIHAILGENGAGKTTLMNIIYGLYHPDEGQVFMEGRPLNLEGPHAAIAHGIGMVHQHFMLIPVLTVAENIVLGSEPPGFRFDIRRAAAEVKKISEAYHLEIDPWAKVGDLTVGLQQRVEILKAFYRRARVLILDEPTAVLTPSEIEDLFQIMARLKADGIAIAFISHKLDEVMQVADRITIMRRGRVVRTLLPTETNPQELANLMVGREVVLQVKKSPYRPGPVLVDVQNLVVADEHNYPRVNGVSFQIRRGEILGLAGVDGNGQRELIEAIVGLRPVRSGKVLFAGRDITGLSPRQVSRAGISYIPQDRQGDGLVLNFTVAENLILKDYNGPQIARRGRIDFRRVRERAQRLVGQYGVAPPNPSLLAGNLSGGNQQKVILAREMGLAPEFLIAAQPTRGLDVGAIEYIHKRLLELRDQGKAILLFSLELEEILSLSDEIAVIYKGQIMDIVPGDKATREGLGLLMLGARKSA
ncbi:MAG: ABC transporter ATP-binding protein [Firmicutes bacterium]|nr:ABC transporter ATP-binding protein [Bacillota bacterium]